MIGHKSVSQFPALSNIQPTLKQSHSQLKLISPQSIGHSSFFRDKALSPQESTHGIHQSRHLSQDQFPQISANISKQYTVGSQSLMSNKSVRDNYGNFYKNLMKPQGGSVLTKFAPKNNNRSGGFSQDQIIRGNNDETKNYNAFDQLKSAKDSFLQMINVINQSNNHSIEYSSNDLTIPQQSQQQMDVSKTLSLNNMGQMEKYQDKLKQQSMSSPRKLEYENSKKVYRDYVKGQNSKTMINMQISMNSSTLLQEKITLKNHLKQFKEDSQYIEGISQLMDSKGNEKFFLNCFKNMEQEFGRRDVNTFEQIIKDLLDNNIFVENLIDKQEIDNLMTSKFYAGYSLSSNVRQQIKKSLEDEYKIELNSLESKLKDKQYCKKVNKSYRRHLKSYIEDVRHVTEISKTHSKDINPSIIEQFKQYKAKNRHESQSCEEDQENKNDESHVELGEQANNKYTSFILFMALQEMIKQVFINCKEKGQLFLRLFQRYFEEQEKHWFKIVQNLSEMIETLKSDREFILDKYVDKSNKLISNTIVKDDMVRLLENREVTEDNLIEHKRLIKETIGFMNKEEDEKYLMELEKKNFESDVKSIFYGWDLVRSNIEFKERIKQINVEKIKEDFMVNEQIRLMHREDFAVLVNLERIRMALSNKGNIKWDLEKIQMEGQNKLYKEENTIIKHEMKKLREQYEYSQELLQERSKEIFELSAQLKKYTDHLNIIEKEAKDIQTDVSFKNEHFTTSIDQIMISKLNNKMKKVIKIMSKASANVQNLHPMPKQEMMDLIQGAYIKKSQEIGTKLEVYLNFDDFVYSVLVQRYGTKKKIDQKGHEFFLALKKYAKEDERVDFFKHFVGFEEQNVYSREVLECYIRLMKQTNESVQNLMSLPGDGEQFSPCQKVHLEYHSAYEKYLSVFNNASSTLKEELKKHLIFDSELIIEGQPKIEVKINDKWELYAMLIFYKHTMKEQMYTSNIEKKLQEHFGIDEENNVKLVIEADQFYKVFEENLGADNCKTVFDVIPKDEFYKKYFGQLILTENEGYSQSGQVMMKIKGMKKMFREKYEFKITLRKFLDLGIKMSIRFLDEAKYYYGKIFQVIDQDGDGLIDFNEFRRIIKKVDTERADWKIHAIFQKATGVDDSYKGQLTFSQFIKCAMNNVLMENMVDWEKVVLEEKEPENIVPTRKHTEIKKMGACGSFRSQSNNLQISGTGSQSTFRDRSQVSSSKK